MGQYTDHWAQYKRRTTRSTLQAVAAFGLGLPALGGFAYLLSPLTNLGTALLVGAAVVWLVALITLVNRGSRVDCPRCLTRYARGKYLVDCPTCGLRMLQENP